MKVNFFDRLFINLPTDWQTLLDEIMHGINPSYVIIEKMKNEGIIEEPYDTHTLKVFKPIFEALPILYKVGVKVFCYRDKSYHKASHNFINEILIMTLNARLGKINPERWREVIKEDVRLNLECCKRDGEYIITRAKDVNVCLDASDDLLAYLKDAGFKIEKVELDRSYKPLDILWSKIRDEVLYGIRVSSEEIVELVKDHVIFTDLLLVKDFESAYEVWKGLKGVDKV
ncbi:MAG: hypothetical protein NZ896_00490 [Nitrososphaerales archaeon]|nr:hypothetical protein [Nitrososphaerales archaeon]